MITNLEEEMNRTLTTEQITMILDFAIQAAEDNGFINRYIFQRAMYVFAAIIIFADRKDEISSLVGNDNDIRLAWDALLQDGTIKKMNDEYSNDMNYLGNVGEDWFNDYCEYAHSARGILAVFSDFSGNIVEAAFQRLSEVSGSEFGDIARIAEAWGLNRGLDNEAKSTLHQHLRDLNNGTVEPPENMPNFKVIPKE